MKLAPPFDVLVADSIRLLQDNAPADGEPYFGCFSGGKDSVVIKRLAEMAGVPVEWHYNVIIDPPELMRFIRNQHPDVRWHYRVGKSGKHKGQKQPFFRRVRQKLFIPTRWRRWCCSEFKHTLGPKGCTHLLGIRAE
jgi:phosphoadenosine phosphosulfate reductase